MSGSNSCHRLAGKMCLLRSYQRRLTTLVKDASSLAPSRVSTGGGGRTIASGEASVSFTLEPLSLGEEPRVSLIEEEEEDWDGGGASVV